MIVKKQNKDKSFLRFESSAKQKEHLELLAKIRGISRQELLTQVVEHFIDNNLQLIQNYKNELEELNNRTNKKIKMHGEYNNGLSL